jgi:hypothetical protein
MTFLFSICLVDIIITVLHIIILYFITLANLRLSRPPSLLNNMNNRCCTGTYTMTITCSGSPYRQCLYMYNSDRLLWLDAMKYLKHSTPMPYINFCSYYITCRSQWPSGLRHELFSPAPTLRSWVRIPHRHGCLCVLCVRFFCFYSLKWDSQQT